jgi:hypothetical protein
MLNKIDTDMLISELKKYHSVNAGTAYVHKEGDTPVWVEFDGEGGASVGWGKKGRSKMLYAGSAVRAVEFVADLVVKGYRVEDASDPDFVPHDSKMLAPEADA